MKIGVILRWLLVSGGGERQGLMLAKELIAGGHTVTIYTTAYDKEKCFPADTVSLPIQVLPDDAIAKLRARKFFLPRVFIASARESALARAVAEIIDPETEVLSPSDNWGMRVGFYFKKHHPHAASVVMLNDVYTARWTMFNDPLFGQKKKGAFRYFLSWVKDFLVIRDAKAQDAIVVPNNRLGKIVKKYFGLTSVTVPSGVDHERFIFTEHNLPHPGETVHLLSHAIFYIHRRFEDTIEAVRILIDGGFKVDLTIIGDFEHKQTAREYHRKLLDLVEKLNLKEVVQFVGRVSDKDLVRYYNEADIFVAAAHMHTWGLVIFEALATGLPVAISRTIGGAEILEEGRTAMMFNPVDPQSQADVLKRLLSDGVLYKKISREGNDFVRARISWSRFAEDMLSLFVKAVRCRH